MSRRSRKPRIEGPPAPPADAWTSRSLWVLLIALAAARAALAFTPGMWAWGLNPQRFLPPALAWGSWAILAACLAPPIAEFASDRLGRGWQAAREHPAAGSLALAVGVATLVWLLPDRVWWIGDFIERQGSVETGRSFEHLFPQALPLDRVLHGSLPLAITATGFFDANQAARSLGALEAGLLSALAFAFARHWESAAGFAVFAIALFGGTLCLFTGYGKSAAELCVLTAAVGIFAARAAEGEKGLLAAGLAFAAAMTLHRSAAVLLPALALAWGLWWRSARRTRQPGRISTAIALGVPLAAMLLMAPRVIGILSHFDLPKHLNPASAAAEGGVWAALIAPKRLADLANLTLALSPLALALPVLVIATRTPLKRRGTLVLITLAASFVPIVLVVQPQQGIFRDWDVFAPAGVALSLLTASWLGDWMRDARKHSGLATAMAMGAVIPAFQWLLLSSDLEAGLSRVRAFIAEPPRRSEVELARSWEYLGFRTLRLGRWKVASNCFTQATVFSPRPALFLAWGLAEFRSGDLRAAQNVYRETTRRFPALPLGWLGLAGTSLRLHDEAESRVAIEQLRRYSPGSREAIMVLGYLKSFPDLWPVGAPGNAR